MNQLEIDFRFSEVLKGYAMEFRTIGRDYKSTGFSVYYLTDEHVKVLKEMVFKAEHARAAYADKVAV